MFNNEKVQDITNVSERSMFCHKVKATKKKLWNITKG